MKFAKSSRNHDHVHKKINKTEIPETSDLSQILQQTLGPSFPTISASLFQVWSNTKNWSKNFGLRSNSPPSLNISTMKAIHFSKTKPIKPKISNRKDKQT